ncbi:hypothetical protein LCGC14_2613510, partial [marine sediment metagenome]
MPNIVLGDIQSQKADTYDYNQIDADYRGRYPRRLDLTPGSELHGFIVDKILERAVESYNVISARHSSWREIDKVLTAYIRTSDKEKELKAKDDRKPVAILFPYSYAMMETMLSYLVGAFFQEPIFQYEGYSPEDTIGAAMMELVIQLHCVKNKVYIPLHTMFRDALSYGMGAVSPDWIVRTGYKRVERQTSGIVDIAGKLFRKKPIIDRSEEVVFEGNSLNNIDPYMFLPDPNAGTDIQSAEYLGWVIRDNYMSLIREEQADDKMFNVKFLKAHEAKTSIFAIDQSEREKKTTGGVRTGGHYGSTNRADVLSM